MALMYVGIDCNVAAIVHVEAWKKLLDSKLFVDFYVFNDYIVDVFSCSLTFGIDSKPRRCW
jgi:hypothetical protein